MPRRNGESASEERHEVYVAKGIRENFTYRFRRSLLKGRGDFASMNGFRALTISAAVALMPVIRASAQAPAEAGELTAEELLQRANAEYAAGHWEVAAAGFMKFIKDFGQRPEAAQVVSRVRYPLARCMLQLKKYPEAITAIDEALVSQPPIAQQDAQELYFWRGICLVQEEQWAACRETLEKFIGIFPKDAWRQPAYIAQFPASRNVPEAQLLIGISFVLENKLKDAADYLAKIKPGLSPIMRGRASVIELHALVESDDLTRALGVVTAEFPRLDEMMQLATFQTLTLELGSRLLDRGECRQAIACLSRVWNSARLVAHQEKRLSDLEARLSALNADPRADVAQKHLVNQLAGQVRRELEAFRKIPNFDSALRLRLATAFQTMQRYRETALILESMLRELPADTIVEQASVSLVQCWSQIERWPKVGEAADAFVSKFPKSKSVPLVLYLKGVAQQKDAQYAESIATFEKVVKEYSTSDFAPRAVFMQGFTNLLADQPAAAIPLFERFPKEFPMHEMAEPAAYWRGMAYSLDKQFEKCRAVMDEYMAKYPHGENRGLAVFRKAYAAHSLRDYKTSIPEMRQYLRESPQGESTSEALVLLGDALMAQGEMEDGIATFKRIPPADVRFFEEGWFKIGKALKLLERFDDMRAHMEQFVRDYPRSGRIGEAIYWVGWVHKHDGKPEEARKLYWDTIKQHGDEPAIRSVDDLFAALAKLYKGEEEQRQFLTELRDLREDADKRGKKTLALRALWAQAGQIQRREPEKARELLLDAAKRAEVQSTNPLILADIADAFTAAKQEKEAEQMWRDLLKWNPRAPQKDRALAALGAMEMARGNEKAALEYFDRFQKETAGSMLLSTVQLSRAHLLEERGAYADAQKALEDLLANKFTPGRQKSEALYRIGEMQMRQDKPGLAVPYYQRIYVMYGRWPEWVAKAYLRSGEAFEKLQDLEAARKTYAELIDNETLKAMPEHAQAEQKLEKLGGRKTEGKL